MNVFYDKIAASTYLEARIAEPPRNAGETEIKPLWNISANSFETFAVSEPPSYRLKEAASEEAEEITFRVRGILCQNRLPPIRQVKNIMSVAFLRQTVQLVTFSATSGFGDYLANVEEITSLFQASIQGKVAAPPTQLYEGYRSLVLSNPYFTRRNLTPSMASQPLGGNVDPTGYLTRAQPQNFHHTMDNEVVYLKECVEGLHVKFKVISPDSFENGDIVEAQFSFVAFPIGRSKDEFQLRLCLRAVISLNDTFRRASLSTDTNYARDTTPVFTLKRKVNYAFVDGNSMDSEEENEAEGKRFRIEL